MIWLLLPGCLLLVRFGAAPAPPIIFSVLRRALDRGARAFAARLQRSGSSAGRGGTTGHEMKAEALGEDADGAALCEVCVSNRWRKSGAKVTPWMDY